MVIAETKTTMNFLSWPLAQIRALTATEISAPFDADSNVAQAGNPYRLNIAAGQRFLHKNTLCGTEDTQWMATWIEGRTLHVAFFSGQTCLSSNSKPCKTPPVRHLHLLPLIPRCSHRSVKNNLVIPAEAQSASPSTQRKGTKEKSLRRKPWERRIIALR